MSDDDLFGYFFTGSSNSPAKTDKGSDEPDFSLLLEAIPSIPINSRPMRTPELSAALHMPDFTFPAPLEEQDANKEPVPPVEVDLGTGGRKRKRKRAESTTAAGRATKKPRAKRAKKAAGKEPEVQQEAEQEVPVAASPPPVEVTTLHNSIETSPPKPSQPSLTSAPVPSVPPSLPPRAAPSASRSHFVAVTDEVNEWNSKFRFADADLALISSDGFQFKVHQAMVVSASPKLYQMVYDTQFVNPGGRPCLTCLHPVYETGEIISLFLRVLYQLPFPLITFFNYRSFGHTVYFMRQHGCTEAETLLRDRLRRMPLKPSLGLSPLLVFLVGAMMSDVEMCTHAIKNGRGWMFGSPATRAAMQAAKETADAPKETEDAPVPEENLLDLSKAIGGYSVLDPRGWSAMVIGDVPPKYVGMMLRLVLKYGFRPEMSKWEQAADDFRKCMLDLK